MRGADQPYLLVRQPFRGMSALRCAIAPMGRRDPANVGFDFVTNSFPTGKKHRRKQ